MIISHKHKFIFIKNKKVAGTSFEILLSNNICGPQDIITPISYADELYREKFRYGINYDNVKFLVLKKLLNKMTVKIFNNSIFFTGFYNHMTLEALSKNFDQDLINKYYKLMIVRNPYDRLISQFFYVNRKKSLESINNIFSDWFNKRIDKIQTQSSYAKIEGDLKLDLIIRYENLQLETYKFLQKFGYKSKFELPKAKSNFRSKCFGIDNLDKSQIKKINLKFEEDFINFGYDMIIS